MKEKVETVKKVWHLIMAGSFVFGVLAGFLNGIYNLI